MGKEFFENFKTACEVIEEASQYVDSPLQNLMFEGPHDDLRQTNVAQTALFAVSVAILKNLREFVDTVKTGILTSGYSRRTKVLKHQYPTTHIMTLRTIAITGCLKKCCHKLFDQ